MTFLQMKCFLSLAKTRKLSATAAAMGLSLSTLSKDVDRMEDELSVKLFTKNQQRLVLTREGELIFPSVEYIVKQYDEQRAEVNRYASGGQTTLNIAMAFHQNQLVRRLIAFMKMEPKIRLNISEVAADDICSMLESGDADVGIIYEQWIEKKYPVCFPLRQDRMVAAVSVNHRLANRTTVSLDELRGETFYLFKGDRLMYQYQLRICISAGFVPEEKHSDFRVSTILKHVAAGQGVSLLVENTVKTLNIAGVTAIGLEGEPCLTMCLISASVYPSDVIGRLSSFLKTGVDISAIGIDARKK